ncbi:MAG TPA: S8 family serine peptidase [Gaiellaceae bacterium]|nr:S8 family serine peptidase [Gaiellaceae bacterium]
MPPRPFSELAVVVAVAVVATVLAVGAGGVDGDQSGGPEPAGAWAGLVGGEPADVELGQRMIVVLKLPSLADRVREAGGRANDRQHRRWTRAAASAQKLFISRMTIEGARIQPDLTFTRVLNGFSATLDPRSLAVLERSEDVDGVYPVRAAFPAAVSSAELTAQTAVSASPAVPGFDGRGVTVALLDTGVDRSQPALARQLLDGVDIVGGSPDADAAARPGSKRDLERHGTELAGIVAGAPDEAGFRGVAPRSSLLPIRVAGWQQAADGFDVYARTDQVLAGLDRAVDPNDDGDAHDAARVALVGVAAHFAAFADDPLARAAAGALALDTLVVAPAGNDGPKGPGYGSISAPGGAPAALTVAAADVRPGEQRIRLVVRAGLDLLVDRVTPLAAVTTPVEPMTLPVARPRMFVRQGSVESQAAGLELADFFDRAGFSRVAGTAALVPGGREPARVVDAAVQAGASAVLVYGSRVPPGGLGLDARPAVPVVAISDDEARATIAALDEGASVGVSLGSVETEANPTARAVASFSSSGLAFDGRLKPELAGPGVSVLTTEPGVTEAGSPRLATLNGSSAAAAAVSGAAAALAQARPGLDASLLKSALVGSAQQLDGVPVVAQGAGLVDPAAAAAAEVAAAPSALAFGRASGPKEWKRTRTLTVHNISSRRLRLRVRIDRRDFPAAETTFVAKPARLTLRPGRTAKIRVKATVAAPADGGPPAEGLVVIRPRAGVPVRVPFAVAFAPRQPVLLGRALLSRKAFEPSDAKPALLLVRAGSVRTVGGVDEIEPLERLDVELWTSEGERLGVIARIRDVLPGSYTFGLTGRTPDGDVLEPGPYRLRLVAYPTLPGKPVVKTLQFTVK